MMMMALSEKDRDRSESREEEAKSSHNPVRPYGSNSNMFSKLFTIDYHLNNAPKNNN
jgi:hypothetical protein